MDPSVFEQFGEGWILNPGGVKFKGSGGFRRRKRKIQEDREMVR